MSWSLQANVANWYAVLESVVIFFVPIDEEHNRTSLIGLIHFSLMFSIPTIIPIIEPTFPKLQSVSRPASAISCIVKSKSFFPYSIPYSIMAVFGKIWQSPS